MSADSSGDVAALGVQFLMLSLLAVGGASSLLPEIHRYVVETRGWMGEDRFAAVYAVAQAAPGPNLLFVSLIGWHVAGLAGALGTTLGLLLPSSLLSLGVARFSARRPDHRLLRCLRLGLAPITIGLTLSTGWLLAPAAGDDAGTAALTVLTVVVLLRFSLNPLWLIGAGAL